MKIIKRQDIYQLEDWRETYPKSLRPYTVGCYPTATRNGKNVLWLHIGDTIRIALNFRTIAEAESCYNSLIDGSKTIKDYANAMHDKRGLAWID